MLYFIIAQLFSFVLDFFFNSGRTDPRKDLAILLLRQQVSILQRQHPCSVRELRT